MLILNVKEKGHYATTKPSHQLSTSGKMMKSRKNVYDQRRVEKACKCY